jgi:hypothetical protein
MRRYRLTLTAPACAADPFTIWGVGNTWQVARAFLSATQRTHPARCSIEALDVGGVTSFGLMPAGVVRIERII